MSGIIVEEWRDLWTFKSDYIVFAFSFGFSILNLLNMPALVYTQGGLAFLTAYVVCLLLCCLPVLIMELAVGQLTGRAPPKAFYNISPLFKGVGVAQWLYSLAVAGYMSVCVGYALLFIYGLREGVFDGGTVPWFGCANEWQRPNCVPAGGGGRNQSAVLLVGFATADLPPENSIVATLASLQRPTDDISEPGGLQWRLIVGLGVVWLCIFLSLLAGVRWLGKVVYFTFLIPLFLLIALAVRAATMEHRDRILVGIYERTNWQVLKDYTVWAKALAQSIYATGVGFGAYITMASYSKRSNNLVCDSFLLIVLHILVSAAQLFTGVVLLESMLIDSGEDAISIESVLTTDVGQMVRLLTAVGQLSLYKVWALLLLVCVALMLFNSFLALALTLLASLEDACGEKASRCCPRLVLAAIVCLLGVVAGLVYTTQAGAFAMALVHRYFGYITIWTILTCEIIAVAWFYCAFKLGSDVKQIVDCCCWLPGYVLLLLLYILPVAPAALMGLKLWEYRFDDEVLPAGVASVGWAEALGWTVAAVPLLPIPLLAVYAVVKSCLRSSGGACQVRVGGGQQPPRSPPLQRLQSAVASPMRFESVKPTPPPRYTASAPGYVLLPQAPLAQPEAYNDLYNERVVRVSNI